MKLVKLHISLFLKNFLHIYFICFLMIDFICGDQLSCDSLNIIWLSLKRAALCILYSFIKI
jgi:hypothetical protein